ncbi:MULTISPECIES: HU family DNA-binding protein [Caproicibacterium]|jgi:DNA-binding protein HU-beta|uniref:Integration host factor subunit alpha n=1 Tax=Caproicibacterium lactatifermentans TaxID=2666138 RepID=A0A859DQ41_9FIRM|nr:HU family DNA-binding protein [Caproicibacterium lactatifermentans]ARP50715.1 integration host factor subunit alpha [Ruminococcaceae bacterium CPB6]MDD4807437.1 HU family DNA-binding protein [Oscillospiraceae bacterium]QKN23555.1 integration host factor subunit alpha [Caproicibacterium lactatifermentans]QKO29768.1 integration host factor subunit alpha [Caproicibacterium lactatifermentans]
MNKTELINAVAEKTAVSKKDTENIINAAISSIIETVADEEKVQLAGFGTFECRNRSARQGRDPRTNTTIEIPASKAPAFKAGKAFKDAVNK